MKESILAECKKCGDDFTTRKHHPRIFCSKECRVSYNRINYKCIRLIGDGSIHFKDGRYYYGDEKDE